MLPANKNALVVWRVLVVVGLWPIPGVWLEPGTDWAGTVNTAGPGNLSVLLIMGEVPGDVLVMCSSSFELLNCICVEGSLLHMEKT